MTLALEPEAASIHCRRQPVNIATQEDGNKAIAGMQKGDKYVVFDQGGKIKYFDFVWFGLVWFMVSNATFNNISVISCHSVLLVEETGVPGKNHQPATSN